MWENEQSKVDRQKVDNVEVWQHLLRWQLRKEVGRSKCSLVVWHERFLVEVVQVNNLVWDIGGDRLSEGWGGLEGWRAGGRNWMEKEEKKSQVARLRD